MTQGKTLKLEYEARKELLSFISVFVDDIRPGGYNVFLAEFLGIEDAGDLLKMSISALEKVAEAFNNIC